MPANDDSTDHDARTNRNPRSDQPHDRTPMPDNPDIPTDDIDPRNRDDDATFTEIKRKTFGGLGQDNIEEIREVTDIESGTSVKEIDVSAYCYCGRPNTVDDTRRCSQCTRICCVHCGAIHNRYVHCRDCAEELYALDRQVFFALYLLDQDTLALEDLVDVELIDGQPVNVILTDAATTLIEHGYIQTTDDETPNTITVDADNPLTPEGREALAVGSQLYGEDDDVEDLEDQLTRQKIAQRHSTNTFR